MILIDLVDVRGLCLAVPGQGLNGFSNVLNGFGRCYWAVPGCAWSGFKWI